MHVSNSTFINTTVRLDGNVYVKCVFENATLLYGGLAPVSLQGCEFRNVRWSFVDAAANTIQFIQGLYHGAGEGGRKLIEQMFDEIKARTQTTGGTAPSKAPEGPPSAPKA